jgi:hypothetical protein
MRYYLKAATIISRHPIRILSHPKAGYIMRKVMRRQFRLHWLRDIALIGHEHRL